MAEGQWQGRGLGLAPLDFVSRGHVAISSANLPGGPVILVSAYGLMEFDYASGTLLRTLADLEPLLDDPILGVNVLIAGDWNVGSWWGAQDAKYSRREAAVLELLTAYGFVDCLERFLPRERGRPDRCSCPSGDRCRHVWTYKKAENDMPYQDDYVYATDALVSRLSGTAVAEGWAWDLELSDHAPLVLDLDAT